jgi:hypothetical protein
MKRQNGVVLSGKLRDLRAEQVQVGDMASHAVVAILVTDHPAYGGYHQVIFPEEHALDAQAFAALTGGELEVTVEGWLRSVPGNSVVVVDRAIYLNVTQAQRDQVSRLKAASRRRTEAGRPGRPGTK